jgi:hypothetical protein
MLQAVWVFAIAAVGWPPARLNVGGIPGFWSDRPQKGGRVESTRTHFKIEGLDKHATLV